MGILAGIMVPHPPLIVPAVGRGGERGIAATVRAYERAAEFAVSFAPDMLLFVSPHAVMYADYFHVSPGAGASGNFAQFGAPREAFEVSYDAEFVRALEDAAHDGGFPAGTLGERDKRLDHGVMVPLYFLSRAAGKLPKAVRVGLSGLSLAEHYKFGRLIAETAERLGRRAVVVASGDLSHKLKADGPYGFSPDGPVYDERIMEAQGRRPLRLFSRRAGLRRARHGRYGARGLRRAFRFLGGFLRKRRGVRPPFFRHNGGSFRRALCARDGTVLRRAFRRRLRRLHLRGRCARRFAPFS